MSFLNSTALNYHNSRPRSCVISQSRRSSTSCSRSRSSKSSTFSAQANPERQVISGRRNSDSSFELSGQYKEQDIFKSPYGQICNFGLPRSELIRGRSLSEFSEQEDLPLEHNAPESQSANSRSSITSLGVDFLGKEVSKMARILIKEISDMDFEIDFDLISILSEVYSKKISDIDQLKEIFQTESGDCSIGKFAAYRLFTRKWKIEE